MEAYIGRKKLKEIDFIGAVSQDLRPFNFDS
jgi:hypothetical protein